MQRLKIEEIITKVKDGAFLVVTFGVRNMYYHVNHNGVENRITPKQYDEVIFKFGGKDKFSFSGDFSGITKHFYKLKQ